MDEEHERMVMMKVFKSFQRRLVPGNSKFAPSTSSMQKKANGTFKTRLIERGFEQVDGVHYYCTKISQVLPMNRQSGS